MFLISHLISKGIPLIRKSIFTLAPAALVLLAVAGNTQAATNAQLTVTANVVAATCDVSLSNNMLDLGNFSPKQFTGVLTPIAASQKQFTVGLNHCEAPIAAADTANLVVSGQTRAANSNIFNSTGTNTGIMLNEVSKPNVYLKAGDKIQVAVAWERSAVISGPWVLVADGQQKAAEIAVPVMYASSFSGVSSGDRARSILPSNITLRISTLECMVNTPTSIYFGNVMKNLQAGQNWA